jgi:hypothetical protein
VGLKQRLGVLAEIQPPLLARGWFLGMQLAPVVVLGGAFAWRKRREHLAHNPRVVRRLLVNRQVRKGLSELSKLAAGGDADAFFALAFRLLQERLGERLDLPSAAITEAVLEDQLPQLEVSRELLADLQDLFQACNHQRYASGTIRHDLPAMAAKVEAALHQLQRLKG